MRVIARTMLSSLLAGAGVLCVAGATNAAPPLPAAAFASKDNASLIDVRHRRHRSFKDDYYDDGGVYYVPPQPARIYRVPDLPPPVVEYRRPLPAPPLTVYTPPVYGWQVAPWGGPPRPASCGKYRYWDGEGCADARYLPPYLGPRW
ncbi:hypothetical protein W911_03770 [Hyphomicrobium nitrativorans NL23]|uniref:Uncharacterized protein n=1 Tax=Hyphomicrobium nitrativorans NL23 TaxID=1029756 RepID=V5SHD9_9HYPH|nr:hypothetical protein [Hyphomicrobium nitrativorans]AHB49912.1 hypothetical protein W911_03770 [Hyphomicrobium nitrativorans NL23]